jgi:putative ABC transport system permease protein
MGRDSKPQKGNRDQEGPGSHDYGCASPGPLSFAKRVAVAFVIAVPVGYYLMNKWLSGFVKKIDLGPEIFIMSAIIMTIVSAITLSFQTLQAAFTNPVQEIRREGE